MPPISVSAWFVWFLWFSIKEKNQVNRTNQALACGTSLLVLLVLWFAPLAGQRCRYLTETLVTASPTRTT